MFFCEAGISEVNILLPWLSPGIHTHFLASEHLDKPVFGFFHLHLTLFPLFSDCWVSFNKQFIYTFICPLRCCCLFREGNVLILFHWWILFIFSQFPQRYLLLPDVCVWKTGRVVVFYISPPSCEFILTLVEANRSTDATPALELHGNKRMIGSGIMGLIHYRSSCGHCAPCVRVHVCVLVGACGPLISNSPLHVANCKDSRLQEKQAKTLNIRALTDCSHVKV